MKLLFECSVSGRHCELLPELDVPEINFDTAQLRICEPRLPELSEVDIARHYTELMKQTHGVNDGFYPLGSCTMKYNPSVNEALASMPNFADIHPLQPVSTVQGCLELLYNIDQSLREVCGMDATTLQPAAGAHGELTGLLLIRAWLLDHGKTERDEIIVPDTAHGTNPASASMAGFRVISVASNDEGGVDLDALKAVVGPHTAGLMLTNPNTLGLFDHNILEITRIIHKAGGLCYYDGANLNAIMGRVRPGDMGFDCTHLNLHKTFSTPHGGGGPGSGPVLCKAELAPYLPGPLITKTDSGFTFETPPKSVGRVRSFYGNFLIVLRAYAYILSLGADGMRQSSANAVLNANYLLAALREDFTIPFPDSCMHEFVMDIGPLKDECGVSAMDVAKRMLDFGIHPPTMYFPLIVHESLMVEPTETEGKETLDEFICILKTILAEAHHNGARLRDAPFTCPIGRPDEVGAARKPRLRYDFDAE